MPQPHSFALVIALVALAAGCSKQIYDGDGTGNLTPTQLKYVLDERYEIFFCDPDYYPVGRGDEQERAIERFPTIRADSEKFNAILEHLHLTGRTEFTDQEKLAIYREDKRLASILLEPSGTHYRFELRADEDEKTGNVFSITGDIDRSGNIDVRQKTSTIGSCPICLSAETRIATADGTVPVSELREDALVWSLDLAGQPILVPVVRIASVAIPAGHEFIRLALADGRALVASPGHPTADGQRLHNLIPGDRLDGARVLSAEHVPAHGAMTYDLLPAGPTGTYRANGILLASTLTEHLRPPVVARR